MTVTVNTANIAAYLALDADNPNVDPAFDPDEALPSGPCRTCGDSPVAYDMTTCDECCAPVCVHCARTRDGEDAVCPACHERCMAEYADDTLSTLRAPWRMSIEQLDSCLAFYRTRLRGLGRGCGALTPTEEAHRAEVEGQVNSRHEARRHSAFPR